MSKSPTPQLRFKGFEDTLSLKYLHNIGTWSKGQPLSKTNISNQGTPCIHYGELFSYLELISKIFSSTEIDAVKTSNGNELLFPDSDVTPNGLGRCCALQESGVILGTGINILSLHDNYYPHYIALNVVRNKSQIIERITGTTVKHINSKNLNEVSIAIPSDKNEQREIGVYFKQIDELTSEVEREIGRLEKMKLASLQKMFPRPGTTTPEIRFAGFEGEWRSYQLYQIGEWRKGQSLSKENIVHNGKNKCLHYGQLFSENEFIFSVNTSTDLAAYCVSSDHDLLFPDSDVTPTGLGRCCALTIPDVILGGGINILTVNENFDPHFCALNITLNKSQIIERVTGTTVKHIQSKSLSEITIFIPDLIAEQKAIGEYFRNLDELISAKRQKLAKLRNIKKACLDKMFVNTTEL